MLRGQNSKYYSQYLWNYWSTLFQKQPISSIWHCMEGRYGKKRADMETYGGYKKYTLILYSTWQLPWADLDSLSWIKGQ